MLAFGHLHDLAAKPLFVRQFTLALRLPRHSPPLSIHPCIICRNPGHPDNPAHPGVSDAMANCAPSLRRSGWRNAGWARKPRPCFIAPPALSGVEHVSYRDLREFITAVERLGAL